MFSSRPLRRTTPRISGGRPRDVPRTWQRSGPVAAAGALLALLAVLQPLSSGARRGEPAAPVERVQLRTAPLVAHRHPGTPAGQVLASGVHREPDRARPRLAPVVGPQVDRRHALRQPLPTALHPQDVPRTLVVRGRPVHGDLRPPRPALQVVTTGRRRAEISAFVVNGTLVLEPLLTLDLAELLDADLDELRTLTLGEG